ncbi:MAG TPA: hypothetical protein VFQ25_11895 [Ktedonobacterales bacterium]|nr:hypothetical protein [Ktedonobacterales bacterium]
MGRSSTGSRGQAKRQRRITQDLVLERLTLEDSDWLLRTSAGMMKLEPAARDAVLVRRIAFRYRPGKMGIADALDAVEDLFAPFAALGAVIEPRDDWEIIDEEAEAGALASLGPSASFAEAMRRTMLRQRRMPDGVDLIVDAVVTFDAEVSDLAAAALHWLTLGLRAREP